MINLLPPDSARQLRAARHNSILIRYAIGAVAILGLIVMVYVTAYALFETTKNSNTASYDENQQRINAYSETAQDAKEYQSNLLRAKNIFANEVSYPMALTRIATSLPEGTVISSLALSPDATNQPTTLTIEAKSQEAALAVKDNFEDDRIATNISISSLTRHSGDGDQGEYPFSINLNLSLLDDIFKPKEESDE